MKTRYISVALLIWLFSYQIFSAAWALSNIASENCSSYFQSECVVDIAAHMDHSIELPANSETSHHNKMSMNCDHCNIVCQPTLINNSQVLSLNKDQLLFDTQLIDELLNVFINSLYRPPIPA
jgi:hypothetical protein